MIHRATYFPMKAFPSLPRHLPPMSLVLLLVSLLACGPLAAELVTSELDDRQYRYLRLDNGMQVMLVSDPAADKSAASLDVAVGHGNDPADRQGLAHFLEHMLFLGTEKYPEAGEYQAFIKDHGGSHNAWTTYDHTNYFFSVRPEFLEEALDRFSQFFVAPLFNEELVRRERVIVDSEYSARADEEGRRVLAARRQAMNPAHPRSHFAVGSIETLADREGDPVREDLVDFYRANYSAHLMALSVIGRESLDQLERWVRERFDAVGRSDASRFVAEAPLFRDQDLPLMLEVAPLKALRAVSFAFPVPSTFDHYREKPIHQIADILGHEGEGSLLSLLKDRGWAGGLRVGADSMDARQGLLDIRIDLTREGVDHVGEIGEMLFRTIEMMREEGFPRWRFDELQTLAEMSFRFSEKADAVSLVQGIANRLHDYPWQDVLYGPYQFDRFDPPLLGRYLDALVPDRVAVTLMAPEVTTTKTEQWFGTGYALSSLPAAMLARWQGPAEFDALALPGPNPFVPNRLAMVEEADEEQPRKLVDDPSLALWHDTDTQFDTPRAAFYFSYRSPRASASAGDAALADLFTRVVEDRLTTFAYPAYLAGLGYEVYPHMRGISVRISGFSDQQPRLLERVAESLRDTDFDAARFSRLREQLLESYRNRLRDSPANLAVAELQRLLIAEAWPLEERISSLEAATLDSFRAFVDALFTEGNVVALSVGNRDDAEALAMAESLRQRLLAGVKPAEVPRSAVVRLAAGQRYDRLVESPHSDSVVGVYRQGRDDSYAERALFYLYDQLSDSAFYTRLRTEQKLGYIVQSFAMPLVDVPGMVFLVQSPSAGVAQVRAAVAAFVEQFAASFDDLSEAALDGARAALLARINQRDESLGDRVDRYWRELDDELYDFDSRERLSRALVEVRLDDLRRFAQRFSGPQTPELVIHANGTVAAPAAAVDNGRIAIADPARFKADHDVF